MSWCHPARCWRCHSSESGCFRRQGSPRGGGVAATDRVDLCLGRGSVYAAPSYNERLVERASAPPCGLSRHARGRGAASRADRARRRSGGARRRASCSDGAQAQAIARGAALPSSFREARRQAAAKEISRDCDPERAWTAGAASGPAGDVAAARWPTRPRRFLWQSCVPGPDARSCDAKLRLDAAPEL